MKDTPGTRWYRMVNTKENGKIFTNNNETLDIALLVSGTIEFKVRYIIFVAEILKYLLYVSAPWYTLKTFMPIK